MAAPATTRWIRTCRTIGCGLTSTSRLPTIFPGDSRWLRGISTIPRPPIRRLTGFYARKPIALDRVFIDYHPGEFKPLDLVAGKFTYPWYNTELTWDKDLNPEGFGQTLNFELHSVPVLKRIAVVGFELPFAQVAGVSLRTRA